MKSSCYLQSQSKAEVTTYIQRPFLTVEQRFTFFFLVGDQTHYLKLSAQHRPEEMESFSSKFKSRIQILLPLAKQTKKESR